MIKNLFDPISVPYLNKSDDYLIFIPMLATIYSKLPEVWLSRRGRSRKSTKCTRSKRHLNSLFTTIPFHNNFSESQIPELYLP